MNWIVFLVVVLALEGWIWSRWIRARRAKREHKRLNAHELEGGSPPSVGK